MMLLTIRTDKPEAELGLYNNEEQLAYTIWPAHRELAETIHIKIKNLLESQNKQLSDIESIVVYKGPGSFTGLRIGLSVANALAASLIVPIVGEAGDNWIQDGIKQLKSGKNHSLVIPEYGSPPHTTEPKH